ncbi:MAG: SpaA isopeptide-forming pilin-related protein [Hominimerdicola sp.]
MAKKNLSARIITLITAIALMCSFVVQNVTINVFAAADFELIESTVKVNGQELTDGMTVNNGDSVSVRLEWQLSNNTNEQDFQYNLNLNHVSVIEANLQGNIVEENVKIGDYKIIGDVVYIHLSSEYAAAQERKIWLNFSGTIVADEIEEPAGSLIDVVVAETPAEVYIDYPESILYAAKEAVGKAYQGDDGSIYQDFSVRVSAIGLVTDVVLCDRYGEFLSDVSNVKIDGVDVDAQIVDNGFELNVGTINNAEKEITYTLKVDPDAVLADSLNEDDITNYVSANYINNKGDEKSTTEKPASAVIEQPWIMKSGTIDNNGLITWTITLSGGSINLEDQNVTILDILDFKSECVDSEVAEWLSGLSINDFEKQADGTYTFTYQSQVKDEFLDSYAQVPIENIVTMQVGDKEYTYECTDVKKTAVYTDGIGIGVKESDGLTADNEIKWKITIDVPDKKFGNLVISDNINLPDDSNNFGYHSIDISSITVNEQPLTDYIGTITTKTTEGHGVTGFDLTITDEYLDTVKGSSLIVEYVSIAENEEELLSAQKNYGNSLELDYEDTVTYENTDYVYEGHQEINPDAYKNKVFNFIYKEKDVKGEEGSFTTNEALGWKLKADLHEIDYEEGDIIKLVDTLPDNMVLTDNFSAGLYVYKNENSDVWVADLGEEFYTKTVEEGKLNITVKLTTELISYINEKLGADASNLVIKFHCQTVVEDDQEYLNSDDFYFTNILDGKYNDRNSKQATATQELKPNGTVISKRYYYNSSTSNSNEQFGYTAGKLNAKYIIRVNENKYNFSDTDTIQAVDTMGSSIQLIPDSIVVTNAETGEVLTLGTDYKFTYDVQSNTTIFTIPDETYIKIEYWVTISDPVGSTITDAENVIKIKGYTSDVTTSSTKINAKVANSNAGAVSGKPYVNIYKFWTDDDQMKLLAGSKFEITEVQYDASTGEFIEVGESTQVVTLSDMSTKLVVLYDRFYQLKEVEAPEGFLINDTVRYFAIPGQDNIQAPAGVDVELYSCGQNIYFENEPKVIITGTKTWIDNGNALGIRPENIIVSLYADGQKLDVAPTWVKNGNEWTYTFDNLKKYNETTDNGGNTVKNEIVYTTTETVVPYYTAEQNGYNFTNTVEDEKTSVSGIKTWSDNSDALGIRPENIIVTLYANGNIMNNVPVWDKTSDDVWTYTFENLPKYTYSMDAHGNVTRTAIVYTTTERAVPYYTTEQNGYNFQNTVEDEKTTVSGTKTWVDNNDALEIRPENITVILYANGNVMNNTPVWTKSNNTWEYTFEDLPKYTYTKDSAGNVVRTAIEYTTTESVVPYYTTAQDGYNFTNTVENIKVEISGTKTWAEDYITTRPDSIIVKLLADGVVQNDKIPVWTNTDENVWVYTFGNLPKYKYENNNGVVTRTEIVYTVIEEAVAGYTATYSDDTFDITNTYVPKWVDVSGTKTWVNDEGTDYRPDSIQLVLKADGEVVEGVIPTWSNTNGDEWSYVFANLPERNNEGYIINYTVEEIVPDNYTVSYDGNDITNTLKVIVEISKQDITGSEELVGAELKVTELDGNVIDSWISNGEPHKIIGVLEAGETYKLTETTAPDGYYVAETITFTVNADGTVTKVVMKDKPTQVEISKQDITNNEELPGAQLTVTDSQGNVIDSWTSTEESHIISGVLVAGETYTLTEVTAPEGYYVAESVEFTVNPDGTVTEVVMLDKPTVVEISKQDITNSEELPGAELKITDVDGNVIDSWTSTDEPHKITATLKPGETYIITETTAPNGYCVAEDVVFTVNEDGSVTSVVMQDKPTVIEISKQDITNSEELPGAELTVTDSEGNVIDSWTSTDEPHKITATLNPGETYTLTEVTAPNGYYVAEDVVFTVNEDGSVTSVVMQDKPTVIEISKQDITNSEELPGAELTVTDSEGNVIDSWTSTDEPHKITATLNPGETYTLTEVTAPNGYSVAESIDFEVNADGTVTTVVMQDKQTEVEISKRDITGENELPGATLEVRDLDGNLIDTWVSDGTPHKIVGKLNAGQTYTLTEITAPDGYSVAETIAFTVNNDQTVTQVVMKDKNTEVKISKQDITTGEELAGAKLEVKDLDGNVIDTWISETEPHMIEGKLNAGQTYILTEITAPNGYSVAEAIEFTVNMDQTVTVVVMQDKPTEVKISKQDFTTSEELVGAKLEVTDLDGNVIDSWVSDGTPHLIKGKLNAGQKYRLTEITAPDGYAVAETIEFTVNMGDTVTTVVMKDKKYAVETPSDNPNTGAAGTACAAGALLLATVAAAVSRKKKN